MKIGINGFGRIGKSLFLQLLCENSYNFEICAINAIHLSIHQIENYLKYDSTHNYDKKFTITMDEKDTSYFHILYKNKSFKVKLWSSKNPEEIDWNVDLLFEASGAFLTTKDCLKHKNVKKVIITAPAKDNTTPTFIYNVNHTNYKDENIISCASCTTTCITPFLKFMDSNYIIDNASFTTIHASTSSQYVLDTPIVSKKSGRSSRSIFNNLIPATTGASSAIKAVLPKLEGKIHGMAIRVPTNNVSLVDLVIECNRECAIEEVCKKIENLKSINMKVEKNELVSSDFQTTTHCTIIDKPSMIQLAKNKLKLLIWYDNEWSYSAQCINMAKYIYEKERKTKYNFINEYVSFKDKNVLMRMDYNIPFDKNGNISDNFRIVSTLESIHRVLKDKPNYIVLATHLGRPDSKKSFEENQKYSTKYSTIHLINELSTLLNQKIYFLKHGVSYQSIDEMKNIINQNYVYSFYELDEDFSPRLLNKTTSPKIFLLENLRFHSDETNFENPDFKKEDSEMYQVWNQLGNTFVNCAFGCSHRNHLSMYGYEYNSGLTYYDYLMEREMKALEEITINPENKKILTILGGAKIDDKLPLCNALLPKINNLYLGGGIINSYIYNETHKRFIETLDLNQKTFLMEDGYGNISLNESMGKYLYDYHIQNHNYYDIGNKSLNKLYELIDNNDIIFWNGTLGVVEHELYKNGSEKVLNYLLNSGKRVIIGGGDTAGFINQYLKSENIDIKDKNIHICTGGGASIEFIIHGKLRFE